MAANACVHTIHGVVHHHLAILHRGINCQSLTKSYLVVAHNGTLHNTHVFHHNITRKIVNATFASIFLHLYSCKKMIHAGE